MTVYLIRHPGDAALKIGFTDGEPLDRLRELQTGSASVLKLVAVIPDAPRRVERQLHRQFADLRIRNDGEWFRDRPSIHDAFRDHRAAKHREHLEHRIDLARRTLGLVFANDEPQTTNQLEQVMQRVRDALDPTSCGCVVDAERDPRSGEPCDPVSSFWDEFREQFVWDLLPFTFLYDLYLSWLQRSSSPDPMLSRPRFINGLLQAIDGDEQWLCRAKGRSVRSKNLMNRPEPLIAAYDLLGWRALTGDTEHHLGRFIPLDSYRGILRRSPINTSPVQGVIPGSTTDLDA